MSEEPNKKFQSPKLFLVKVPNLKTQPKWQNKSTTQKAIILVIMFENATPNIIRVKVHNIFSSLYSKIEIHTNKGEK